MIEKSGWKQSTTLTSRSQESNVHWVIQENLFKEAEWDQVISTLERFKIPYSVHKVIPFIGELVPPVSTHDRSVICLGSYSMRHAAKKFAWNPGVYDLFDLDFTVQMQHWGQLMLNADSTVVKFKDAVIDQPMFIRPIDDSKYFAGRIFDIEEFFDWKRKVVVLEHDYGNSLSGETFIQLSKPKKIFAEYRLWVVGNEIVTWSLYKRGDRVIYSSEVDDYVLDFGYHVISLWKPHRAFVLDVCDTADGMKIVEINTLNAAGFYAADVKSLILSLEQLENK